MPPSSLPALVRPTATERRPDDPDADDH
jgi:hypothetical protein